MTDEDIVNLDAGESNLDDKTGAALAYARQWVGRGGNAPPPEYETELQKHYSPSEIDDIKAVIAIMDFANRTNNTYSKPLDRNKVFAAFKK